MEIHVRGFLGRRSSWYLDPTNIRQGYISIIHNNYIFYITLNKKIDLNLFLTDWFNEIQWYNRGIEINSSRHKTAAALSRIRIENLQS